MGKRALLKKLWIFLTPPLNLNSSYNFSKRKSWVENFRPWRGFFLHQEVIFRFKSHSQESKSPIWHPGWSDHKRTVNLTPSHLTLWACPVTTSDELMSYIVFRRSLLLRLSSGCIYLFISSQKCPANPTSCTCMSCFKTVQSRGLITTNETMKSSCFCLCCYGIAFIH